ncbi:MAG: hypothetical protein GX911_03440 [Spirochaetales bacterium]|nr:hypothetical protein [Spirochaetales bacterium]
MAVSGFPIKDSPEDKQSVGLKVDGDLRVERPDRIETEHVEKEHIGRSPQSVEGEAVLPVCSSLLSGRNERVSFMWMIASEPSLALRSPTATRRRFV